MKTWIVTTCSSDETRLLGEKLGNLLEAADFVALTGELGAGKTQFTKGIALGLGVPQASDVTSPTYTLLNSYSGRLQLHHFDLYRLSGDDDIIDLGFYEYFSGSGVCIVEWADRLQEEMPSERLTVSFSNAGEENREIRFAAMGERYDRLLDELILNWLPA